MRKNVIKFAAIALLSSFALTACNDEVIARPTGYDDDSPVATIEGFTGTVYNNNFKDIYDSIRSGTLASDVLDQLLYQYSVSVFGNYNAVTASKISQNKFGETTLKLAVAGLNDDDNPTDGNEATKAFIKAHSAYWTKNKDGKRVDDENKEVDENADPSLSEYARLNNKWKTIEKRIAQKLYAQISGGAYSERSVFEEEKFLRALAADIENNVAPIEKGVTPLFEGVLTSKVEDYAVFEEQSKNIAGVDDFILHRENYQSNAGKTETESVDQDATYVEDKIIPDIYRQLLVEQYILDESYDTLGRTSARNISVLSIQKNSSYSKGAVNLMNTFINDVIFDDSRTEDITLATFKTVSNAWLGTFMSEADYNTTQEYQLMSNAVPEYLVAGANPYFQGTAYGDMMEQIEKINANPALSENENDYTGNNTYTVEIGKQIKTRELELTDYTSTGWYVKSSGAGSLPDTLKNQLFDINVANANNEEACVEYSFDGTSWNTNETEENRGTLVNVVGKIKGQYFLRKTSRIKGTPVQSDILFENDDKYYIVLVEDAIRSKNLDKKNFVNASADELDVLEDRINNIVQIVADNDTYKTLSKKHWLEKMELKYHDEVVYKYFKDNFPELFD